MLLQNFEQKWRLFVNFTKNTFVPW